MLSRWLVVYVNDSLVYCHQQYQKYNPLKQFLLQTTFIPIIFWPLKLLETEQLNINKETSITFLNIKLVYP